MRRHLLLFAVFCCQGFLAKPSTAQAPEPAPVEVEVVDKARIVPTTVLLGTTEPKRESLVAASIEGYVIGYPIEEGRRVKEGEVLARLRDSVLRLQLKEAEAALEETRARHGKAKLDLERARSLIDDDAVTQKELDAAVTTERTLALQIIQAEAKIDILKDDITRKLVVAPFDGQVVREHTQLGEWVMRGGGVADLVDLSSVYVRVNVPERYVRFAKEGQIVTVWVPAARREPWKGRLVSVSGLGDPEARTFPVRVELKNDGMLRAGMSSRVELSAGTAREALVVSKDAILLDGNRSYAFVVAPGDQAERRELSTGVSSGTKIEVLEGLGPGERVIVRGNERIQPGAPLRVIPPGPARDAAGRETDK